MAIQWSVACERLLANNFHNSVRAVIHLLQAIINIVNILRVFAFNLVLRHSNSHNTLFQ